jgi:hypothetical protein
MAPRLNTPPGWPPHPEGWVAPPGWEPDPSWPEPPAGWQLWLNDAPASLARIKSAAWIIVGGGMVLLSSPLPFAHTNTTYLGVAETFSGSRLVFPAVLLIALGICVCWSPQRWLLPASITSLVVSLLGTILLGAVIVAGTVGYTAQADFGISYKVTLSIGVGLLLALAGFVVTVAGSVRSIRQRKS